MLPVSHQIAFLLFALLTGSAGVRGFYGVYRRIVAGREDTDLHLDDLPQRLWHAVATTLTQSRTFRKRPVVSLFHSFIFYGFGFYLLVNLVDGLEGYLPFSIRSTHAPGALYNLLADLLSGFVLIGVLALVVRRFLLPSRADFGFNERTLVSPQVAQRAIPLDSVIVSTFILLHVGSRIVGAGAKLAAEGPDRLQPVARLIAHSIPPGNAEFWRIFGYWGALGSVLVFLSYFPYSKHIHIFLVPLKYLVARRVRTGVLPAVDLDLEAEEVRAGAHTLEDLAWPRLLDAYACIQCNRCQDACPATATGKALSPSALEINKRMELNGPGRSERPLLTFALSPEALWGCTTCGACLEVCPVQDEPMLDILDIRRHQVLIAGEFPLPLQTAFRGMERAKNPWGVNRDKRMEWAEGLQVKTVEQNPEPDVLYWVGCAASYDPQSQKTARALVQLLDHAGVNYAVLGKKECCTGDSARRAGNELLYQQLAQENIATLAQVKPKLIVASCPHCMNALGQEYRQLGGEFAVVHHTEYLDRLVAEGRLTVDAASAAVAFHDPCYLGRHNHVYDAPRNLLRVLTNDVRELERHRENSFCCGAGGAQFWKEEEPGRERIASNRLREAQQTLDGAKDKVLAVGCPFCKSMLQSAGDSIAVKDVAELLLEGVKGRHAVVEMPVLMAQEPLPKQPESVSIAAETKTEPVPEPAGAERKRKAWVPKTVAAKPEESKPEDQA